MLFPRFAVFSFFVSFNIYFCYALPVATTLDPVTVSEYLSTTPIAAGLDGPMCENTPRRAWLDLVVIIEMSQITFLQWNPIQANVLSYLSRLTIADAGDHTTRITLITYDNKNASVVYGFADPQSIRRFQIALNKAKPMPDVANTAKITFGLQLAKQQIDKYKGYRIPGVVIYAATYDNSGVGDPTLAAKQLKMDMVKIVTISYDASNGITTPYISALASPGLALTSHDDVSVFGWAVGQLNCICPAGWTQLVIGTETYSDCFYPITAQTLPEYIQCPYDDNVASVYTPNRLHFLQNNITGFLDGASAFSVGLYRNDENSSWYWKGFNQNITYNGYPEFKIEPTQTDIYGYFQLDNENWNLYADDGVTNSRTYICQTRSCDTDYVCDVKGMKHK